MCIRDSLFSLRRADCLDDLVLKQRSRWFQPRLVFPACVRAGICRRVCSDGLAASTWVLDEDQLFASGSSVSRRPTPNRIFGDSLRRLVAGQVLVASGIGSKTPSGDCGKRPHRARTCEQNREPPRNDDRAGRQALPFGRDDVAPAGQVESRHHRRTHVERCLLYTSRCV